jgi:hypothetical protein
MIVSVRASDMESLSGDELRKFLGPVSPNLLTWKKVIWPDMEMYSATANPPLSGSVGITMFLWTWKGAHKGPGGPDHLGTLSGGWLSKDTYLGENGELEHQLSFNFCDDRDRRVELGISSPVESDMTKLIAEISRLPIFNSTPSVPFHDLMVRKRIGQIVDFVVFPLLFAISVWLPLRSLRKRNLAAWCSALMMAAISLTWLALFFVSNSVRPDLIVGPTLAAIWESNARWRLYSTPLLAFGCLIAALLALLWLLFRWSVSAMFTRRA